MNLKVIIIYIITAVLFAASGIMAYILMKPSQNENVEIVSNGNVLYSFDLSKTENQSITIMSADGKSSNTICIENGTICVSDAECPDKTCVKSGMLRSEGLPIVCLPNKLIVRFCEEG